MATDISGNGRRSVSGIAFKDCEFCGRAHKDKTGNDINFQYTDENGNWDTHVYCSKICRKAWNALNGGR